MAAQTESLRLRTDAALAGENAELHARLLQAGAAGRDLKTLGSDTQLAREVAALNAQVKGLH